MREMALLATSNGDSDPRLYGSDPNNGNTWDADRIYGCICDEGWTGYDCSERECTYGDDPNTYGQVNEVQLFECAGTAGTLTLSFRQKTTLPIPYNATRQELEEALEWLTNIGDVIVLFSSGSVQRREFKLGQPCALSRRDPSRGSHVDSTGNSTCTDIGLSVNVRLGAESHFSLTGPPRCRRRDVMSEPARRRDASDSISATSP